MNLPAGLGISRARARLLSGRAKSCLVLLRDAGSVQIPSATSSQVIPETSERLAPVRSTNLTTRAYGAVAGSVAAQKALISSSVRTRWRARSLVLVRAIPRTIGER